MEYRRILEELNQINLPEAGLIVLRNSVEKYNFFVRLYNNEINIVNNTRLYLIPSEFLYNIGHSIQNRIINFFFIFIILPGIILLCRFLIPNYNYLFFILMTTYNTILTLVCLITCILQIISKQIYKKNRKLISNPFQNMVYYPDLCVRNNVNNEFLEINFEDLDKLNITDSQKNKIKENNKKHNNEQGKLRFMIYDQGLIDYYSGVNKSLRDCKPNTWLFFSIGFLLFFTLFRWV